MTDKQYNVPVGVAGAFTHKTTQEIVWSGPDHATLEELNKWFSDYGVEVTDPSIWFLYPEPSDQEDRHPTITKMFGIKKLPWQDRSPLWGSNA